MSLFFKFFFFVILYFYYFMSSWNQTGMWYWKLVPVVMCMIFLMGMWFPLNHKHRDFIVHHSSVVLGILMLMLLSTVMLCNVDNFFMSIPIRCVLHNFINHSSVIQSQSYLSVMSVFIWPYVPFHTPPTWKDGGIHLWKMDTDVDFANVA
jgi:hypothetical protein